MSRTRVRRIVAMIQVESVEQSAAFYGHLGFKIDNTFLPPGAELLSWAWLESGEAQLMLTRAAAPDVSVSPRVVFYLYVDRVEETRRRLLEAGFAPGPIEERFYAPQGEFRLNDPDGNCLMITHV